MNELLTEVDLQYVLDLIAELKEQIASFSENVMRKNLTAAQKTKTVKKMLEGGQELAPCVPLNSKINAP